ncbi:MAG: ribosome-associated translation inhibitor RaiA [Holophagales bacterium]|nr:ribosome-associated translation inhibitor RaiA [Holophagales bacterium]
MKVELTGRHIQLHEDIKSYSEKKLAKLEKLLEEPIDVHLILEVEKLRSIAEIHATHRLGVIQAKQEASDLETAVHDVIDTAIKQARRGRKKLLDKRRRSAPPKTEHWPVDVLERTSLKGEEGPRVIKRNTLPIKPMTVDEASLALEDSKNDFYVFLDAGTEKVSVIYRRKDDNYGLIAPEF